MPDTQETTSLIAVGAQAGAQKTGERFADRALNTIVDGCKKMTGNTKVLLGTVFTRYLKNAWVGFFVVVWFGCGVCVFGWLVLFGVGFVCVSI